MSDMDKALQELKSFKVPPELHSAAETLLKYYQECSHNKDLKDFYDCLRKHMRKPNPEIQKKSPESGRGGWRTVKVHTVTTGETFGAGEALMKQVETLLQLHVQRTSRNDCHVVVLFCPINSCVGSDVEAAMTQVSDNEKVILVLMHHTRDVDYSTSVRNWSETYRHVIMTVDVLFHETEPGLLTCQTNREAVHKIQNMLLHHSSWSRSSCHVS
ncbi:uncharacterized protein LOC111644565 [Seriola lalandi dorsalis]|uniref:uncharacterized protein LOC111644565 n=1 Tax=Seriola lalandi dorsalis TaxID=1841481 RepID=UPI000C6F4FA8|nr:uncharacterized protein LOC111644565 [Seriola lalandi dorsalis]